MHNLSVCRVVEDSAKPAVKEHLLRLTVSDRYMRFCSTLSDQAITRYVDGLKLAGSDVVFAVFVENMLVGMLHVAPDTSDSAEFALSVDVAYRKQGIGDALFERGLLYCKSVGIRQVYMSCLATNYAIQKMAARRGMAITTDRAERIARLNVNDYDSVRAFLAAAESSDLALYDTNCKYARQAWDNYVAEIRRILHK